VAELGGIGSAEAFSGLRSLARLLSYVKIDHSIDLFSQGLR
jgi:hypothetical protein